MLGRAASLPGSGAAGCSTSRPRDVAADDHVDSWPPSIRKLFILPGAGARLGTTRFRLRNGKPLTLESDMPCMALTRCYPDDVPASGWKVRLRRFLER